MGKYIHILNNIYKINIIYKTIALNTKALSISLKFPLCCNLIFPFLFRKKSNLENYIFTMSMLFHILQYANIVIKIYNWILYILDFYKDNYPSYFLLQYFLDFYFWNCHEIISFHFPFFSSKFSHVAVLVP